MVSWLYDFFQILCYYRWFNGECSTFSKWKYRRLSIPNIFTNPNVPITTFCDSYSVNFYEKGFRQDLASREKNGYTHFLLRTPITNSEIGQIPNCLAWSTFHTAIFKTVTIETQKHLHTTNGKIVHSQRINKSEYRK